MGVRKIKEKKKKRRERRATSAATRTPSVGVKPAATRFVSGARARKRRGWCEVKAVLWQDAGHTRKRWSHNAASAAVKGPEMKGLKMSIIIDPTEATRLVVQHIHTSTAGAT